MWEWVRIHPGYYTRESTSHEIVKTGARTWTLEHPFHEERRFRSLRAAKEAADRD